MAYESCILRVPGDRSVVIRESLIIICESDHISAMVLGYLIDLTDEIMASSDPPDEPWIYATLADLSDGLIRHYAACVLGLQVDHLECLGYIKTKPTRPRGIIIQPTAINDALLGRQFNAGVNQ